MNFFINHLWEIFFGLIAAGALGFCKYLNSEIKRYKKLIQNESNLSLKSTIDEHLKPIEEEIARIKGSIDNLQDQIKRCDKTEHEHILAIQTSYKFRLVQLCKLYLKQGYMTQDQYDQLVEMYKVYHEIGGNGQAQEYYERTLQLPIRNN